jgi:hypothetical protein
MAGGTRPTRLLWALFAASVVAVGAVAFIIGAFIVNSRETVHEVVRVPPTGVTVISGGRQSFRSLTARRHVTGPRHART